MTPALTAVPTAALQRLLRLVLSDKVVCPLSGADLHLAGFANVAGHMDLVKGLERRGVEAVLRAALAERLVRTRAPGAGTPV